MQQNFNRRLELLLSDISDDIKAAVDDALEHTAGGDAAADPLIKQC